MIEKHMTQSSQVSSASPSNPEDVEGEMDLVATWLVFDPRRTIAGALAGIFAGLVAWTLAGFLAKATGHYEFWYPFKIPALILLGRDALTYGNTSAILIGTGIHCGLCAVLGMVYSHFFKSNRWDALLAAGFMWGTFSWVFINNLFVRSILNVRELEIPNTPVLFILIFFGFALASLKVFNRLLGGRTN
jgi:hypothetical protein